jgi:hypothetical protein
MGETIKGKWHTSWCARENCRACPNEVTDSRGKKKACECICHEYEHWWMAPRRGRKSVKASGRADAA